MSDVVAGGDLDEVIPPFAPYCDEDLPRLLDAPQLVEADAAAVQQAQQPWSGLRAWEDAFGLLEVFQGHIGATLTLAHEPQVHEHRCEIRSTSSQAVVGRAVLVQLLRPTVVADAIQGQASDPLSFRPERGRQFLEA